MTTLHYADAWRIRARQGLPSAYAKGPSSCSPDVYAVQGYDAAQMLAAGVNAVKGDMSRRPMAGQGDRAPRSTASAARSR